jgi:hypothetical protein
VIRVYPAAYEIPIGDGLAVVNAKLEADVQFGDLTDVDAPSPSDKDVLQYQTSTSKWTQTAQTELVDGGNF